MLLGHDRLIGCLVTSGTMISADALFTTQYASNRERDWHSLCRPGEGADRAAEDLVHQARCLCRSDDGDSVEEHSAEPMRAL